MPPPQPPALPTMLPTLHSQELSAMFSASTAGVQPPMPPGHAPLVPLIPQRCSGPDRVMITSSLRSKVRALQVHGAWPFWWIVKEIGIAISTVFSICSAPFTPKKIKPGHLKIITVPIRKSLIDFATVSENLKNHCLPLGKVA